MATAASWPFGIALTSWNYMWRTTPIKRMEEIGSTRHDSSPPLPSGMETEIQRPEDGVGPLFHRRYVIRMQGSGLSAGELMTRLRADVNAVVPTEFARFLKVRGGDGPLSVGDEYVVRMPGPWDGPVRVVEVTEVSLRLATLEGHLEAGQIEFRSDGDREHLVFSIESWARSADRLSNLLYHQLRMAKETQLHMWISVLERVGRLANGTRNGPLRIETRRIEAEEGAHVLGHPEARSALDALHSRALNFDLGQLEHFTPDNGWEVDDYCRSLPPERPGSPVGNGSWERARRLIQDYEFADPAIVRAVYHSDRPLEQRDMLLELRFWGLRFSVGVRVAGVHDDTRTVAGRQVRVWGWSYLTLQGHLEMGQMDYEVWKWMDTGEVEFRIHRVSRPAAIRNPLVRLGFRFFGRRKQIEFARHACDRMEALTAAALAGTPGRSPVPRVADALSVEPASGEMEPRLG